MNKALRYGARLIKTVALTGFVYLSALMSVEGISNFTSPKIQSQSQLERLLEQERRKIDPKNNCSINARLINESIGESRLLGQNRYEIRIGGYLATESTLRHELYHILDRHDLENCSAGGNASQYFRYLFWCEPQAAIYESTGLKP